MMEVDIVDLINDNQMVIVQADRYQSVLTAVECFTVVHRTCRNTSGSTKASNRLSAMCVSMHVVRGATLQHTCCAIPPINHSYATAAAKLTNQELLCDGMNAATSTDAVLNVTSTYSFFVYYTVSQKNDTDVAHYNFNAH